LLKRIIVAIDGPAGSGKSTLARRIASRLGFLYIDTGAMYRAVALWARRNGTSLEDHHRLQQLALSADIKLEQGGAVHLNGEDVTAAIREPDISQGASRASAIPGVRRALVVKQRQMAEEASVVMEGRDIGTVVFPDAEVKVFLDASTEVRARRRWLELRGKGTEADLQEVEREIRERDERDSTRAEAPLMQAPDATYVDTSLLSLDEVEEEILRIIRSRTSNGKGVHR
jgi:CMP/dCMP kinase